MRVRKFECVAGQSRLGQWSAVRGGLLNRYDTNTYISSPTNLQDSRLPSVNLDKVRVLVAVFDQDTGEQVVLEHRRRVTVPSIHHHTGLDIGLSFVSQSSFEGLLSIEGSPLSWFYGQNACGPDATLLVPRWINEVLSSVYPGVFGVLVRYTYAEVFRMLDAGDKTTSDQTVLWFHTFGNFRRSRNAPVLFQPIGTGVGTVYSREIRGHYVRRHLSRGYNKGDQIYNRGTDRFMAYLPLESTYRQEFALGCDVLREYMEELLAVEGDRQLTIWDFETLYIRRLNRMDAFDPTCPPQPAPLTDKQQVIVDQWMAGADESSRDWRTLQAIRMACGYDLRRPYADQRGYDHSIPHLTLEQLRDPSLNVEKTLWQRFKDMMGEHGLPIGSDL